MNTPLLRVDSLCFRFPSEGLGRDAVSQANLELFPGEVLAVLPRELASLPAGYFRRAYDVVGRNAQRNIGAGEVLGPGA